MNILLVAYYYPPPDGAGTGRPEFMARALRERGHRVTVLTRSHSGDKWEAETVRVHDPSYNGRRRGWRAATWLARRLWVEMANSLGSTQTILSAWYRRALRAGRKWVERNSPHLVMATYPPAETLALGMELARYADCPLVADFRDGLVFEPVDSVLPLRFTQIQRKYIQLELDVLNAATGVLAAHPALADYLRDMAPGKRVLWLPNGFDPQMVITEPPLKKDVGFHLVHTGRFGLSDPGCDPSLLVRAMGGMPLDELPFCLHLVGKLSRRERRLFRPLERRGRARLHGSAQLEVSRAWQVHADGLLMVLSSRRPSVIPGKLLEYLPMQAPILALAPPGAAVDIVSECGRGWVVDPRDPGVIETAFAKMISGETPPGKRDEVAIARFAYPGLARELEVFLKKILETG
ncbi:MAG: glycosyltransferase [Candidatus Aminicenantes bacterium]|nr:glycosyltransferase [Candidatus Aminicenantes bacterium]